LVSQFDVRTEIQGHCSFKGSVTVGSAVLFCVTVAFLKFSFLLQRPTYPEEGHRENVWVLTRRKIQKGELDTILTS
jgi:hypothetical protein